jgi:predicted DsbA family dithiol-disulfide isomerase
VAEPEAEPLPVVTVDLWADIGCPWCYVGSRRLALAVAREEPGSVQVRWRAHPAGLREGVHPDQTPERLVTAGREVGLRLDPVRTKALRDSRLAQRAVLLYDGDPRQRAVVSALFAAAFEEGLDVMALGVVVAVVAKASGDAPRTLRTRLDAGEGAEQLARDAREAVVLGVTDVPTYVVGGVVAVRGDQQPAILRGMVAEARRLARGVAGSG